MPASILPLWLMLPAAVMLTAPALEAPVAVSIVTAPAVDLKVKAPERFIFIDALKWSVESVRLYIDGIDARIFRKTESLLCAFKIFHYIFYILIVVIIKYGAAFFYIIYERVVRPFGGVQRIIVVDMLHLEISYYGK